MMSTRQRFVFGQRLREARLEVGYSQEALAEKLHLSDRTVRNWERGDKAPRLRRLAEIAAVLGKPMAWFFAPTAASEPELSEGAAGEEPRAASLELAGESRLAVSVSLEEKAGRDTDRPAEALGDSPAPPLGVASGAGSELEKDALRGERLGAVPLLVWPLEPQGYETPPEVTRVGGSLGELVNLPTIQVPAAWLEAGATYALRLQGGELVGKPGQDSGVQRGDVLAIRPQEEAQPGETVVVHCAGGAFRVGRLHQQSSGRRYLEGGDESVPLAVSDRILGRAIGLLRSL